MPYAFVPGAWIHCGRNGSSGGRQRFVNSASEIGVNCLRFFLFRGWDT